MEEIKSKLEQATKDKELKEAKIRMVAAALMKVAVALKGGKANPEETKVISVDVKQEDKEPGKQGDSSG